MSILLENVEKRFQKNQNWLCLIVGGTGSGKSWSAIKLGEVLDPDFSIENICFYPEELLKLIKAGELKKGAVIVYDEAGITFGSRDFYTDINKALSYTLQGFRAFNYGVIFTTPSASFIDVHARKLFHNILETISLSYVNKYCVVKWKDVQHNPILDKTYYKYPRVKRGNRIKVIKSVKIYKASDKLLKDYEEKKMRYIKHLIKSSLEDVKREELKKHPITDDDIIAKIKRERINWKKTRILMGKCNIYRERAYRIQAKMRER